MVSRFFLTPVFFHLTLASELSVSTNLYIRCNEDDLYIGSVLGNVVVRSTSHCAAMCSRDDRCQVINVCPRGDSLRQVDCSLLGDCRFQDKMSLENGVLEDCLQMVKVPPEVVSEATSISTVDTTELLQCENGGNLENGRCQCPMQYGGTTCQRLIRDCTEPYESGHRLPSPGKAFLIQPAGTAVPFTMICILDWGGVGYALIRTNTISFNASWTTAKTWIGDNLSANESDAHYFIGLENFHQLLRQANYQANLHYTYNTLPERVTTYYTNFAIGPEDSSYAMSYTFTHPSYDDGFKGRYPTVFSTWDHDLIPCNKSYPGWFGSDCAGYSVFADPLVWPVNGSLTPLNYVNIGLVRISNFTVS